MRQPLSSLNRALSLIIPTTVALLLIAGLWIIYQGVQNAKVDQQQINKVQAEILAESVVAPLDFGDRATAAEAANALRVNPRILAAGVYDAKGDLFASYARLGDLLPPQLRQRRADNQSLIAAIAPVTRSGTRIGTVYLVGSVDPISNRLRRYAIIAVLVVLTSLVLILLDQGQRAMRKANAALAATNRELQIQMEERGRAEEQLREAQRMQALGQLTGGIAHDFNNLLAVIQGAADILQRPGLSEEKRLRFTSAIITASERAALLTGQLLAFARRQALRPEVVDLNANILKMMVMLQPSLNPNIILNTQLEEGLRLVEVDPGQFEAALLNIVVNARDAMPDGGTVTIRTRNLANGETVAVSIEDDGCGIDPDKLKHVFEPFFTTKAVGKGTGLGLSQVYGFAAQSGGEAQIESMVGKGTTLTIMLPATAKTRLGPSQAEKNPPSGAPAGRVLLVEDNEEVGNLAEALLRELGHSVVRARNGAEALRLADQGAAFDILFTDMVMPGITGLELAQKLKQRHPRLPIVLTTGYSERMIATGAQSFPVLPKPFRLETLASTLNQALAEQRAA